MSDFLRRKYRTEFRLHDLNKDGVLTPADFQQYCDRFSEGDGNASRGKTLKDRLTKYYDYIMSFGGEDEALTEERFIEANLKMREDPKFPEYIQDIFHILFTLLDLDGDGYIQEEEYITFFAGIGCEDHENLAKKAFKELDTNGDGVLSYDEVRKACFDYYLSDDESTPGTLLYGPLV